MIAIIKEISGGFSTAVINDDMSQPTEKEQHEFMTRYASAVLSPTHITAVAGDITTNITLIKLPSGEEEQVL